MSVHDGHPPYQPVCNERHLPDGQLRGACLNDDGTPTSANQEREVRAAVRRALHSVPVSEPDPTERIVREVLTALTAPTPAAPEPGTGTRDALAALYALADEWDTDMTAVRGGGVVSHHAAQLRTLAATLVPEPGTGTTARPPGPPGPPTATRAGVTYIYDVGSGYWLAPDGRKIRDLPPETPAALAALDALTGELDARTRAKQGLHYLEVVTLRNRLRDFAAALAPEVARIEAEAREAELREAADAAGHVWQADMVPATVFYRWLRDRADHIARSRP